jgi:glycosyltransferase involved in cell wall biosynthesis
MEIEAPFAMTTSCKISVIMPCFNHGEFLAEAVGSVKNIKRDDIELIVVDDGSTDDRTRKEMDKLCEQGLKVIRQENKGPAASRNAGIRASRGEYLLPLDGDDRLRSGWIDHAIGILDSDPGVGVVYGDAQCFGTRTHRWQVGPFDAARLLYWNFIHASALYRRPVWEQNSGYDETRLIQGLEDWDFWLGALEHGWRFAYLTEVFFDYRQAEQSMTSRAEPLKDQIREFVTRKHAMLYRQALFTLINVQQSLEWERQSLKWTLRHLRGLLAVKLKSRFSKNSGDSAGERSEPAKS